MTVVTRCQILRLKCTKFDSGCCSAPDPARGAYSAPPDPQLDLRGLLLRGQRKGEGREKGWEEGRKEKGRKGEGKGKGDLLQGLRGDRRPCK